MEHRVGFKLYATF